MAQEEIIFPNNIRNIRAARGMKMTELARRANLSLSAVSKIEKGVRRLNQKQLLNVCTILGCKLSDIFIHESDAVADQWQSEIKRRLTDNEGSGLKVFGSGLRKIRQRAEKTIAETAKAANMTLSVYHKIEIGQREVYQDEIGVLAKIFGYTSAQLFDEIAKLYNAGELTKQINKVKERVKSVLEPVNPMSGLDVHGGLYGAQLYDNARKKLVPVFGTPDGKFIKLKKSLLSLVIFNFSIKNSIASGAAIGINTRRNIHILGKISRPTNNSSFRVPDLVTSIAGKIRLSDTLRSKTISLFPVPLNSSKITSSIREPVSTKAVAIMVKLPPSSTLRAAPKKRLGF